MPVALSILVFFALCCQCASTLAIIRRETNSWRWPAFTFLYMTVLAYVGALIVYQATSRDPVVLTGVVVAMALLGLVATWIPARRALSIDPAILLREE